ncbi:hypothetical protein [Chryseobacterium vrystaatense]|uniref:Lipoprotein n=1 Tax=Chryseobacterium vrystaatense TaxID=307480 RepID=A0A1M5KAP2_9FLAO|nr:hypothetical protein [Chryseobacterium vrystaatense]SHG49862.1 hypothetical protein SAMN02787073_4314 [Chryseobacterium vrystaatense]
MSSKEILMIPILKTDMKNIPLVFILLLLLSCESDKERLAKVEKECSAKTAIDGFNISFFGYFPKDADSVGITIKRGNQIIKNYTDKIPDVISDSLRNQRNYILKNDLLLTDTVFIKIKNEPVKKIYDFKYLVRSHYTMMSKGWGCDFYEMKIDGKIIQSPSVDFTAKNWKIIEKKDFRYYYHF